MGKFTFSVSDLMFLPLFPPCIFSYIFSYILFNCFLFLCYSCVTFFPFPSSSAISSPSLVQFLLHNRYSFLEFYFFSFLPLLVCLSPLLPFISLSSHIASSLFFRLSSLSPFPLFILFPPFLLPFPSPSPTVFLLWSLYPPLSPLPIFLLSTPFPIPLPLFSLLTLPSPYLLSPLSYHQTD